MSDLAQQLAALLDTPEGRRLAHLIVRRAGEAVVQGPADLDAIIAAVEVETGLSRETLLGYSRRGATTVARLAVVYLARELTITSLPEIGEALGGRSHTTILSAEASAHKLLANSDERFGDLIVRVRARLLGNAELNREVPAPECET